MTAVIIVIAGVAAFVAAAYSSRPAGRAVKRIGLWAQVMAGVLIVLVATAVAAYGLLPGNDVWWGVGLGLGFGGLSGLRYGQGTLFDLLGRRKTPADGGARR
jgi:hypothetical protein